jgi:nucleoside 2-deoxyribosyltransferase
LTVKIYLCGPINGCTDEEANDWRSEVKANWPGACVDPMVRDYRGVEDAKFKEIVELDKLDVMGSDVILVNYDKPSVGTAMEVLFAHQLHKPIIVVHRPGAVISPWLRYHATHLVTSFQAALRIASSKELWDSLHPSK